MEMKTTRTEVKKQVTRKHLLKSQSKERKKSKDSLIAELSTIRITQPKPKPKPEELSNLLSKIVVNCRETVKSNIKYST